MDDALPPVLEAIELDAEIACVANERVDHLAALGVGDLVDRAAVGRHIVIRRRDGARRLPRAKAAGAQQVEGRRIAVVNEMLVDVEKSVSVRPVGDAVR